ncbi:hypothetical protein [Mycolicibacterium elephantis]|nr:hypothetical protein [Mycolicibacterium elephantis]
MADDKSSNLDEGESMSLPSIASEHEGAVVVALQPEGLLVGGDTKKVNTYLERVRVVAGHAVEVSGIDKLSLGNATGLIAGVTSLVGNTGKFVQLHPDSLKAIQRSNLVPGTDGFFRMMTRGADGTFVEQLQWKPANVSPAQLMSVQMIAVQLALKSAVAEITDAIKRVEGKVDELLRLAHANRSGDVLGDHASLARMLHYLERHGVIPDADWDSIASTGPYLNRTVEQLRQHAERTLEAFSRNLTLRARAGLIQQAVKDNRLGETLSLLVVAEESLYKWQRLRIARVEATQPEHLQTVLDDARELIATQMAEDGKLYRRAREVLDTISQTQTTDGFWFWAVDGLKRDLPTLREDLDRFAKARRAQASDWEELYAPTLTEAASYVVGKATDGVRTALNAGGNAIGHVGSLIFRRQRNDPPAEPPPQEHTAD